MANILSADWFARPAPEVAVALLGCTLVREIQGETVRGEIVETEAYQAGEPAMHAYRRPTERNRVVFGPAGVAYVYRIYRQYHCFNIVTDREGLASTILIRAVHLAHVPPWLRPSQATQKSTKTLKLSRLAAGPGKLCQALNIDETLRGQPICPSSGLWIEETTNQGKKGGAIALTQTTRIGLSQGIDLPWRWYVTASPAISRKAAKNAPQHQLRKPSP